MTTIVLSTKERAICADRQVSIENGSPAMAKYRPKIQLLRRDDEECILAYSGNLEPCLIFEKAFIENFNTGQPIKVKADFKKMSAIAYYSDGTIHVYEGMLTPIEIETPYFGIGSGSPFAVGALYHGAKLKEAVRIACLCDPFSGFGIQYVQFSQGNARNRTNKNRNNNRKGETYV